MVLKISDTYHALKPKANIKDVTNVLQGIIKA